MAMTLIVMDLSWSRPEREEGERDREERRGRGTDKRGGVKDREEREGNRQGAKNWNGDPA